MGKLRFAMTNQSPEDAFIERERAELLLPPNETHSFPGWVEILSETGAPHGTQSRPRLTLRYSTGPKNADGQEGTITLQLPAATNGALSSGVAIGTVKAILTAEIRSSELRGSPILVESPPVALGANGAVGP